MQCLNLVTDVLSFQLFFYPFNRLFYIGQEKIPKNSIPNKKNPDLKLKKSQTKIPEILEQNPELFGTGFGIAYSIFGNPEPNRNYIFNYS